jgi:fumarate hydratase class II
MLTASAVHTHRVTPSLRAYADVVMVGRTHLQDATPLTLGQVISGWVGQLDHAIPVLERAIEGMYPLAIGGTAVGADPRFRDLAAKKIAPVTGKPFFSAANKFAALSAHNELVNASAALRALMKIANDVRFYACGRAPGLTS